MDDVTVSIETVPAPGRASTVSPMTDPESPGAVGPPPTVIRVACILLVVVGFASVMFSLPAVADASGARCRLARARIDSANADSKPWNNVDTGGKKAKDLPCADALRLAGRIRQNEKGTSFISMPSESAVRLQSTLALLIGIGQAVSGVLVLRGLNRPARNAAIGFTAFGLVLPILGFISFGVGIFVLYALVISPQAKDVWGKRPA
jgi:hypothetical protein